MAEELFDWPTEKGVVHPTVTMASPWGESAEIDVDLEELIAALWAAGLQTVLCCQGDDPRAAGLNRGRPYVVFNTIGGVVLPTAQEWPPGFEVHAALRAGGDVGCRWWWLPGEDPRREVLELVLAGDFEQVHPSSKGWIVKPREGDLS